ncbi:MAG: hypothetical protein EBS05_19540 [Proteobacteria bacterium]|nr:hypothetical protein [Pseudomonadota bacterium]
MIAALAGGLKLVVFADEKPGQNVLTLVSQTGLSGYVSITGAWSPPATPTPTVRFVGFTNNDPELTLNVKSGRTNQVEFSTILLTWVAIGTVAVPNPPDGGAGSASVSRTHSNAAQLPCFYYRLVELP